MPQGPPGSSVEAEARQAYGRLVALLAARSGDLAGAEDALGDALVAALERWPIDGTPANPQAWLLTVARRRSIDGARQRARAASAQAELGRMQDEAAAAMNEEQAFPDARLGLMLACAHPAVDVRARTPLMLQAVLGLTAERMASAFLASPAAMTKRLVRAKAKLAAAGVRFNLPGPEALSERIEPLLDAIYAAFTLGRDDSGDSPMAGEALWLGRLLAELAPDEPEAAGLLSLMLFVSSRAPDNAGGGFTPLSRQDPAEWNLARMVEAEERLRAAGQRGRPGRFQLEAAIQAVHADRRRSGRTDWAAILILYDGLLLVAPTIGAQVARAAALAQSGNPAAALAALDPLEPARVAAHQPYWATRAFALAASGDEAKASDAYLRAAGLTEHPGIRAWLLQMRAALAN
jgi:RNA polymerase sigma-70 factor (ECF subfamily)